MELRQLATFLTVAHRQSFTRAAVELHLTQPAVTRQIAALEAELRLPLFDRLGKTVRLTGAGEVLLRYAEQILRLSTEAQEALADVAVGVMGRLAVGASTTLATYLLPEVLTQYRAAYPGVELTIRTGVSAHIIALVLAGAVDVGLVTHEGPSDAALLLEPLGDYATVLVSPPNHPLAGTEPLLAQELKGQALLLMEEGTSLRSYAEQLLQRGGVSLVVAMELDSVETIKRMVEAGLGISLLPALAVREEVAAGRLVARTIREADPTPRGIALARRRDKFESAATRAFVGLLATTSRGPGSPPAVPPVPQPEAREALGRGDDSVPL